MVEKYKIWIFSHLAYFSFVCISLSTLYSTICEILSSVYLAICRALGNSNASPRYQPAQYIIDKTLRNDVHLVGVDDLTGQ